jgi:dTDP-4-amino-4,6-dideoxygalactose transaminase
MQIADGKRDSLKQFLADNDIPSMVYYPIPLYKQEAFKEYYDGEELPVTEKLCSSVLSLPIHTEMDDETLNYITNKVKEFFK